MAGFSEGLIKVLDAVCDKFGLAINWSQDNVLPYIQQLITKIAHWEIATSLVWMSLALVLLIISIWARKKYKQKRDEDSYYDEEMPYFFICILAFILSIMMFIEQGIDIATAITFPEKTAIEFVQDLQNKDN